MVQNLSVTHRRLLDGGEDTSGLHHVLGTGIAPLDVDRVPPAERHQGTSGKVEVFTWLFF